MFDFGSGEADNNFNLGNHASTVSATSMKVYKNGVLIGTKTDGFEPLVMTREFHYIGASDWGGTQDYIDGTIARSGMVSS